ncbi:crotonobetainyl-CoA:carnitine CoA-transferase CaiB-like acyl-CoA transferase [Humitalea rosea]|uniref:Crotonobetainyl-CoA:carnitine CoA-transferase CaiB-like acyl-CoA transferase n=1 Tax=Humitalea rosea TaxID=990373 RepID=A0A2W7IWZ9_9PROT|nr:CaiB/BaiF CoA-transferase family protein [Humitalea rosea]PZW50460.1 crotonobetainyl-CoA:carnitine CoA-transferase CaiB-like acyl-CoA transferase [Humitalea rosea]
MTDAPSPCTALSRFTVLDLTRVRSGPTCVRQLADWGANVIKIEMPEGLDQGDPMGGPRMGSDFQNLHRNKRALTLNLKQPEGVALLKRLVETADVIVENFRPDVKERLGIGYADLSAVNPRLIYASISGFGQDGPYAGRPGFDQIAQGMGGLMSITGEPGHGPMRVGIPIADLTAGIFASQGIMVALLEREVSGKGQWVQTSLLQAQAFMLDFQASRWLMQGQVAKQAGNDHPTSIPTGVFPTADGFVNIAASGNAIWARCAKALGLDALITDPRFSGGEERSENRHALNALIAEKTKAFASEELVESMNKAGVPCGPINTIDKVFADPQVQHLGIAQTLNGNRTATYVGQPFTLSRTNSAIVSHPPAIGEHTDAILADLGMDAAEIARLREAQVV